MFLALTAIEELWDTSQQIVFLGEWCIKNDEINPNIKYPNIKAKVESYHWNNLDKVEKDNKYIYSGDCDQDRPNIIPS